MPWGLVLISLMALCSAQTVLKGATSQSSDYTPAESGNDVGVAHVSGRAVDGNNQSCSHTENQTDSWWRIDLRGVYTIHHITIHQAKLINTNINGAQIHIGNSRKDNGTANALCKRIGNFTYNEHHRFDCNASLSGRYVTVFFPGTHFLALCEVSIYGTMKDSPFMLIAENKTWEAALNFCRDHHTHLASIVSEEQQAWAELEAANATSPFVWLGLRYTCTLEFWFWVQDIRVNFTHWDQNNRMGDCDMSGAMENQENHLWSSQPATSTFNFICTI